MNTYPLPLTYEQRTAIVAERERAAREHFDRSANIPGHLAPMQELAAAIVRAAFGGQK